MSRFRSYVRTFTGFERDARLFLGTALLAGAAFSLYWIDFNLYLAALGLPNQTIGLIATLGNAAGAAIAFPASWLSDRIGRRLVLFGGLGVMAFSFAGFSVTSATAAIALLVVAYNAGLQTFFVVTNPFLMEHSTPEHRNELFSVVFAIENVTNIVAAIVGGVIAQAVATAGGFDPAGPEPFRILLLMMTVVMTVSVASIFLLRDDRPRRGSTARPAGPPRIRQRMSFTRISSSLRGRGTFIRLLLPTFLISIGAGNVIPYLNLFVERRFGLEIAALNAVFAVTSLGTVVAILFQPVLARRLGKVASVVVVQGASIPFLVVLGFSPVLWTVVVAMAVRNSLMNAGNPIANAFAMERVRQSERATFSAASAVLWSCGWVIGGLFYSGLQATLGFDGGYAVDFVTVIVLYSVATALYWRWFGHDERAGVIEAAAWAAEVDAPLTAGADASGIRTPEMPDIRERSAQDTADARAAAALSSAQRRESSAVASPQPEAVAEREGVAVSRH